MCNKKRRRIDHLFNLVLLISNKNNQHTGKKNIGQLHTEKKECKILIFSKLIITNKDPFSINSAIIIGSFLIFISFNENHNR